MKRRITTPEVQAARYAHKQHLVRQAALQPTTPGERIITGVSAGIEVALTPSQWAWLRAAKEAREIRNEGDEAVMLGGLS